MRWRWALTVCAVLPYTSHPILTATLWGGRDGITVPDYWCANWGSKLLRSWSKTVQLFVEEPVPNPGLWYLILFPLSSMKNTNKVLSCPPTQTALSWTAHVPPGQPRKEQLIKLTVISNVEGCGTPRMLPSGQGYSSAAQHLSCKHKVLSSILSTKKKVSLLFLV